MAALHMAVLIAASWLVSTFAGTPGTAGSHDGPQQFATFAGPTALDIVTAADCTDSDIGGDVYVVDNGNQSIRRISLGEVTTFVPVPNANLEAYKFDFGDVYGGGILAEPPGSGCGCGTFDRGLFVAVTGRNEVPEFTPQGAYASRNSVTIIGRRTGETLAAPVGLAVSPNFGGQNARFLYIANAGDHTIRRVAWDSSSPSCPTPSKADVYAGAPNQSGTLDGAVKNARFNTPRGLAIAPDGSLYVADSGNHVIRRIDLDGVVSTVAGDPDISGSNDGPARGAHFNRPMGVAFDSAGNLFITDTGNNTVRMLSTDGNVTTIAGAAGPGRFVDGPGPSARFSVPVGIKVAADGTILVADAGNQVIRRIAIARPRTRAVRRH